VPGSLGDSFAKGVGTKRPDCIQSDTYVKNKKRVRKDESHCYRKPTNFEINNKDECKGRQRHVAIRFEESSQIITWWFKRRNSGYSEHHGHKRRIVLFQKSAIATESDQFGDRQQGRMHKGGSNT
jgi:hypothetical protein